MVRSSLMNEEKDSAALNANQIKRLVRYAKPYKKQVALTVLLMMVATLSGLLGPYFLRIAIDEHIPNGNIAGLWLVALLYLLALLVSFSCTRMKIALANRTGQWALYDMRRDLFNHVQGLSFSFFGNTSAGRIMVRIVNDINNLNNLFTNGIVNVITELSMLVVAVVMMFWIHPQLALVTFTTVPLFMLLIFLTRNKIKREWRNVRRKVSNLNSYIHENIVGMRVIQAYVRQEENSRIFHQVIGDVFRSWMRAIRINSAFGPTVGLVSTAGTLIIYWYGARLLALDEITVGVIIAFTVYLTRFWRPITMLANFYNNLQVAMASSERIFELMDVEPEIQDSPTASPIAEITGAVEFANVSFGYEEGQRVLKNVSFQVKPGETIALVGPTGSGKTTIVSLLARFYDPVEGKILLDGRDLRTISLSSLREHIGIMQQEPFIFSGTVMDNIRYGKPDATEEEVIAVSKAVCAHDFIVQMEDGYQTMVHERGSRLSIGQRQLICFARVLLADPDILILDEATASVDTHTERLLQEAINTLLEGRTSFVIAHRLSTICNAHRIMVIQDGEIAEAGTHEELLARGGLYHQLYTVQYEHLYAS